MNGETEFKVEERNGIPVVGVIGALDHCNVPKFRSIISDLIAMGHKSIVVDMSETDFMDSGGMSGVIHGLKLLFEAGGRLFLANCNSRIMHKLRISGFTTMPDKLGICDSLENAVSSVGPE